MSEQWGIQCCSQGHRSMLQGLGMEPLTLRLEDNQPASGQSCPQYAQFNAIVIFVTKTLAYTFFFLLYYKLYY